MKHLIAFITGIFLSALVAVSYADQTIHKGKAGKNVGTSGNDIFYLGNVKRAGARLNKGTVSVHARGGNDVVYADRRLLKKNRHDPDQWGAWGCSAEQKTCLVKGETRQGVVAFMNAGDDTFHGSEHGDIAFTGNGADLIHGNGGDDVLIANGAGKTASLNGGAGNDLLWNLRATGTVYHYPGSGADTIIAGNGADWISKPMAGDVIIGYDPSNDSIGDTSGIDIVGGFVNHAFWRQGWQDIATEVIARGSSPQGNDLAEYQAVLDQEEISLPSINLLGHSFALSEDAVDMDKATVVTTVPGEMWRDIYNSKYSNIITWIPLKDQYAITDLPIQP